MKTTLDIPDPLFRRVKARAAMEGQKLKQWVTSALRAYLKQPKPDGKNPAKSCPFPLIRGKGGPLLKQMSNQTIAKLEAEEDVERGGSCRASFWRLPATAGRDARVTGRLEACPTHIGVVVMPWTFSHSSRAKTT